MSAPRRLSWRDPWIGWSVGGVIALAVAAIGIGFVWLPSASPDYLRDGLWAAICRAAGVPAAWLPVEARNAKPSSEVVLAVELERLADPIAVGRGATLAMQCTVCHGARGLSETDAPNLAGQYPEVIYKQLRDYRDGHRSSIVMGPLARALSDQDLRDVASYYAFLPRLSRLATRLDTAAPALVRVGAPLRNIAPCASCHGGIEHKPGSAWLEGMPAAYLKAQLEAFASGTRRNDINGQMRNVARHMTGDEIEQVATYYGSRAATAPAKNTATTTAP